MHGDNSIEDEIDCKFKVRATCPKNNSDSNIPTDLLPPPDCHSAHYKRFSFETTCITKDSCQSKKKFGFEVSSRVVDFNEYLIILFVLLMRRHCFQNVENFTFYSIIFKLFYLAG